MDTNFETSLVNDRGSASLERSKYHGASRENS